jgi:hypothetical protein
MNVKQYETLELTYLADAPVGARLSLIWRQSLSWMSEARNRSVLGGTARGRKALRRKPGESKVFTLERERLERGPLERRITGRISLVLAEEFIRSVFFRSQRVSITIR